MCVVLGASRHKRDAAVASLGIFKPACIAATTPGKTRLGRGTARGLDALPTSAESA